MIKRSDLLCVYDFDRTVVDAGVTYLFDYGPNKCHLPLTGAGAPNPPTRGSGPTGSFYTFDGINDYLQMTAEGTARFWAQIPDGWAEWTFVGKARFTNPATSDRIFDAADPGLTTRNIELVHTGSQEQLGVLSGPNVGPTYSRDAAAVPLTGRTRSFVRSVRFTTGAPVPIWYHYDIGTSVAQQVASTGLPFWLRTIAPMIGRYAAAASGYLDGDLYYLAVLKAIPTVDEHDEIQRLLAVGRKPWCRR